MAVRLSPSLAGMFRPIFFLGNNRTSVLGITLTSGAGFAIMFFYISEVFGVRANPYAGIIVYLILPAIFLAGLVLIPIGILLRRRMLRKHGRLPTSFPEINFNNPDIRRVVKFVFVLSAVNAALISVASYRGVAYMDTTQFCGLTCHEVMIPEYTAYMRSPHARVSCAECHIGPGAPWFVRSKLSGTRQVFAVALETYARPIVAPVHDLRPAAETCEQCHWPEKFVGNRLVVRTKFADDEKNTETQTVLMMRVGGRAENLTWNGIHGSHVDEDHLINYIAADEKREVVPWVEHIDEKGNRTVYISSEYQGKEDQLTDKAKRKMDCVDCHNRPTHVFYMPEEEVNQAMAAGRLSRELPYLRRESVRLLKGAHPDPQTAAAAFAADLRSFYQKGYPEAFAGQQGAINTAALTLAEIYGWNVFPQMKITWGTYPNHRGHETSPGCFRCHDGQHTSADGKVITNDCNSCHALLAMDEEKPKILAELSPP